MSAQATKLAAAAPAIDPPMVTPIENQPSHQDIAALAYFFWQARDCQEGKAEEDWFKAEKELIARAFKPSSNLS